VEMVNKSVRHSRICPHVEKRPSIRASIRALEHTFSSVEIENKRVANLKHVFYGIRLALRGRIGLRADLIDYEQPRKAFDMADKLSEDFLWNAFENLCRETHFMGDWDRKQAAAELTGLVSGTIDLSSGRLPKSILSELSVLNDVIDRMKKYGLEKNGMELQGKKASELYASNKPEIIEELNYSALEMIAGIIVHEKIISEMKLKQLFFAREYV
jgi:hypothetical protein